MNKLVLNYRDNIKQLTVQDTLQSSHLLKLLQITFDTQQQILGITDQFGKFYDLNYAAQHIKTLNNHKFNIVTAKDAIQNVSFGSHRSNRRQISNSQLKQKCIGVINDLQFFKSNMPQGIVVILSLEVEKISRWITFQYYLIEQEQKWFQIWNNCILLLKCEIIQNQDVILMGIEKYITYIKQWEAEPKISDSVIEETKKTMIMDIFEQLFNDGIINEIDYFKKKSILLQKPDYFIDKYFTGETIDRNLLFNLVQEDITKSKKQAKLFTKLTNKVQIPILIRKGTNVIQKISVQHPISIQQEHILNQLLQFQLTGLITEHQTQNYKKHVLDNNQSIINLFQQYHNKQFDQIKLAKSLRRMFRDRRLQKKLIQ